MTLLNGAGLDSSGGKEYHNIASRRLGAGRSRLRSPGPWDGCRDTGTSQDEKLYRLPQHLSLGRPREAGEEELRREHRGAITAGGAPPGLHAGAGFRLRARGPYVSLAQLLVVEGTGRALVEVFETA